MGTNYDAHLNVCPHCERAEEIIHIGKSSWGWTFSFHGTDSIRSWNDWQTELKRSTTRIYDEYGERISYEDFAKLVEERKYQPNNHAAQCLNGTINDKYTTHWLDAEGNSFSEGEFC